LDKLLLMAPIEDLESRDLAWISDFVMQQMVIMLRPMMDHLSERDVACDYTERMVQRVSMDISEVRSDLERTNKYLSILRQGMGVQNEGKCMLQRSVEASTRSVKRLDDQMEGLLAAMRSTEVSIRQLSETRGDQGKTEELSRQVVAGAAAVEALQARVELLAGETLIMKDSLLSNEARLEVSQRELRELRRGQLNIAPKLEDKTGRPTPSGQSGRATTVDQAPWPQKKTFSTNVDPISTTVNGPSPGYSGANNVADTASNHSGSRQESRRLSSSLRLQQTCPVGLGTLAGAGGPGAGTEEATAAASRLPLLGASRPVGPSRPVEHAAAGEAGGPHGRLRFAATLAQGEPRGGKPT